jgi:hypothetical protein
MGGTVTLEKVVSPANLVPDWPIVPSGTHVLVAVVLSVHSATTSAPFQRLYSQSKLIESSGKWAPAKSTAKYDVTDCSSDKVFTQLGPGQSMTGCEVFVIPATTQPVELKVAGPHPANWQIAASAIEPSAIATVPSTAPPVDEQTVTTTTDAGGTGALETSGIDSSSTTTTSPDGSSSPGGSSALAATSTTVYPATTTTARSGARGHHKANDVPPKIQRFEPDAAAVGTGVIVVGKKLSDATLVTVNGIPARVTWDRPGRIQLVVPDGATTGPVTITTAGGTTTSVGILTID